MWLSLVTLYSSKRYFYLKALNFFPLGVEVQNLCKGQANKMKIPIFGCESAFKSRFLFFLVSLVQVLSIRDSLPHLHSIVLYGEDEVPADVEASFSLSSSISPSMSDLVLQ